MARSKHRSDESYRSIAGVLKKFLKSGTFSAESPVKPVTDIPQKATRTATQKAASPCSKDMIYALPLRNRRFVGRTEKLKELEGRLFNNGGYQKLALFGLGGVGKSQVALEFAYRVTESRPDYSIFWVPAVSRESFEQAYEDITTRCSIRRFPTFLPLLGYSKKLFQNHLSTASACKWLLIVDNADDGDIVFGKKGESNGVIDYLPKSENGLTLFTTRNRGMAVDLAGSDIVEIHEMGPVEAETFLRQSLVQKESLQDQRIVSELLEELTFLPLAIAQAAAYINTMQITIAGYLHLFQTSEQDAVSLLSYEFHDETRYKDSQNAVASIFDDSFNRIMKTDCIAERILTIMSCLDHKRIPRFMLSASKAIPQHMQPAPRPEAQMTRAIGLLRACGFMTQPNDNETYDMHRIVHLANKVWVNQKGVTKNGKILVARLLLDLIPRYNDSIDDTFPRYDYNDDAFWREYIPQALHFLEGTKSLEIDPWDNSVGNTKPSDARILDEISLAVGNYLLLNCRFEEAANMLNESYFRQDVLLPKRSHLRLEQAERYIKNGQIAAAIEILFHLRVMQKINLPKDEPYLLMLQHELAMVYARDGQMKAAIRLLEHMVAVQHEDDSGRLISQHQLALVYKEDGQSVRAFDLLKHVITVKTILKERYHRRLASDHDIARSYFAKIEMKQKIHFLEDIISIKTTSREAYIDRLDEEDKIARFYFSRVKRELDHELLHHSLAIEDMVSMGVYPRRLPQGNNTTYSIYIDGHMDRAIDQYNYVVATDWTEEDLFQTPSIPLRLQSFS
ncbi:uncharacterized protein KY384_005625 [Bacidia gigantensis]|uniref:uncharacterized protein n=1 Tax=Bacidia gigantensis TaxID=2732470 RepID=UPI001D04541F|nr:uncharacterized protein KY384_005625 [Bacidia gigantensis]KAG8530142.1 hypothetical protein KY384_005625 [Bacidia gigantensis]